MNLPTIVEGGVLDAIQEVIDAIQRYEDSMTDEDMNNVLKAYRQLKEEIDNGNK